MNLLLNRSSSLRLSLAATIVALGIGITGVSVHAAFVRLAPLPAPKIVASAEPYPADRYAVASLIDAKEDTEFASNGRGTNTFVEFDFGSPVKVAAFRHVDRNDPATVGASEITFSDASGRVVATVPVKHVNRRAGETVLAFPEPVLAQRARWRVTQLGSIHGTVGGAELTFWRAGEPENTPAGIGLDAKLAPVIDHAGRQSLRVTVSHPYATPVEAVLRVEGQEPKPVKLSFGLQTVDFSTPAIESPRPVKLALDYTGATVASRAVPLQPTRRTTIYILPHSHTDIGYTEIQTEIEDKQVNNLLLGMKYARQTAGYPPGARFVWNVEVLWAADLFLRRLDDAQRKEFLAAVKRGQVALCGMYLNELTGLCRPEELVRLFRYATQLREQTGATIDSAMISDVPGYTWGTVPAMAQAGIKYFSVAPNYFDRIGDILVRWENKPFWWVGPDGRSKVLVWIPYKGYAMSHVFHKLTPEFVEQYQAQLEATGYPYDIAYMRWAGHGDNAAPDPVICDFVKDWSAKQAWPKFIIASTSEAFGAFERRYGNRLQQVRGDWTPYWEDGAGSSALETGLNRASSDRLAQAEALWAMQRLAGYPVADFRDAWNNVLLYSEHTWGAWCSISEPARRETREQWTIKQSYATAADRQSRDLLSRALGGAQFTADDAALDIFNTASWNRTELVTAPKYLTELRKRVLDSHGQPVPTQTLRNGEMVFLAQDVPALAARRYTLADSAPAAPASGAKAAKATGALLENDKIRVRVDETTGGIVELRATGLDSNLADTASGHALNDYLYLPGDDLAGLQRNGRVTIRAGEKGPLVASFIVESEAPGCFKLMREIRLVAGADFVEIINLVDKKRLDAPSYHAKEGKESVNFAFPFNVPGGEVRLEVPFGVIRPDLDQIPSACKNWFTVGRWADVANADFGVTWVTLDAPLVQVGGITANLLNSQTNPDVWRNRVGPTQRIYSWAMNNHWGTNYRAYQEGPVVFRFILRPHRGPTDPAEATRFATAFSQPLLVTGSRGQKVFGETLFRVSSPDVVVTGLKPSDDGRAMIVRLFNASAREQAVTLNWGARKPGTVRLADTSERASGRVSGPVAMPGFGLVTLRVEGR
jgi:alpha-mannosidase